MKASLKLIDDHKQNHHHHHHHRTPPLLLRAKIPITILNLPFLSHFTTTTTHLSQLSLSLSTNFPTGPAVKLTYATTSTAVTPPLTLTLKSGTGLFGSPKNSPLVISANLSLDPSNPNNPNPTFSIFFKPQLGSFSLRKSTFSHPKSDVKSENLDSTSFGFVPIERPAIVKDLSVEKIKKDSVFNGVRLSAVTQMPAGKKMSMNIRWGVNFPEDFGMKLPVLRVNKIGIYRVDDMLKENDEKKKKNEGNSGEFELLKGMCFWMKRELDVLMKVNKEMKCELEEMKMRKLDINTTGGDFEESLRKKAISSGGFEQWRSNKKGYGGERKGNCNVKKEEKKNDARVIDVENELQRAIQAAADASP